MQQLPAKDQAVFRSIVKFYETKQYKKGIKAADSILKKHPDHGETQCMKGLTLSYLDKKEEAYDLVRKGLKNDVRSHVCWHVFGLLHRQDRNYSEAVKCYQNALRIDQDNIQILRDLSLLQIHRRDLAGFAETRRKLLQLKPSNRNNWVGYAVAEHLCQSHEFAWTCLDNYEKTFKDESVPEYENSELVLYKARIMEEAGKFEEALDCLEKNEKQIVDKLGLQELKARLCMFLGRQEDAAKLYHTLVKDNPEHHAYLFGYMANQQQFQRFWPALPPPKPVTAETNGERASLPSTVVSFPDSLHSDGTPIWGWIPSQHSGKSQKRRQIGNRQHKRRIDCYEPLVPLTSEEEDAVLAFFDDLKKELPRSDSVQRLMMYFVSGDRFVTAIDKLFRKGLRKGVPSLFRTIRSLYFQDGKPAQMEKLILGYLEHLEQNISWFGASPGEKAEPPAEADEETPSTYLFTLLLAAEHFDFLGHTDKALDYINKAIEHTPTFPELYACKARIFKHAGDMEESAKCFEEVRSMDLQDRFLNSMCVRAMLRVDDVKNGLEKAMMFSFGKDQPDAPEASNLHDMQCMWFESALGRSYCRQKNYGKALKEFNETFKHFSDIAEDQFDFHNYCLRKSTLNAYVDMLRMQEKLYSHKFYRRSGKDAIRIYLDLYDRKQAGENIGGENKADEGGDEAGLSAAEKKALKHKKNRAKKKEEEEKQSKQSTAAGGKPKKVDEDPTGAKLLEKDPMEEAQKIVKNLVLYSPSDIVSQVLTYDVFSRLGKWLHCMQALVRMWDIAGKSLDHYKMSAPLAHFCFVAKLDDASVNPVVREVIMSEIATLFGESKPFADMKALRQAATKKLVEPLEKRLKSDAEMPVIEVMYSLKTLKHAGRDGQALVKAWTPKCAFSLKEANKMLDYLAAEFGASSEVLKRFRTRCKEVFPMMSLN
eukprot:TRINITY_DN19285_c0_g1_i1.p2 TRINITY_DN19285_c0_g1~~TRINITY_DN19285_c0_g1_i1.p2  ORF type:complete len:985 (+),score=300.16 TRINITY_DN19285_c0_g1_i1:157-2955(+)